MKIYKLTILFLFLGLFSACDKKDDTDPEQDEIPCIPANLVNDIIAFYPFSNGSLNDFSGNGNHLTNTTSAFSSVDRDGNATCAFEFVAANNDFLTKEESNPFFLDGFDSNPFSISLWFNPKGMRDPGAYELLIGRDDSQEINCPDTYGQWSVGLYDCRKAVLGINEASIWNDAQNGNTGCSNDPSLNKWQHLVVTSDGSQGGIKLYIDGVATSLSVSGIGGCENPIGTNDVGDLLIGKYYTGLIDDIIIFDKVLNASEIDQLFANEACCN